MRLPAKALFVLASIVIAFAIGEVLVRWLNVIDRVNGFPRQLFVANPDPDLGYTMRPSSDLIVRGIDVKTNRLGMRDRNVDPEPAAGTWRILVVGDSVAFGEGLPIDKAFPDLLEKRLARALGRPVEVLNGGVEGYNTVSELAFLRDIGLGLHPRTVVVAFNLNDWDIAPTVDARGFLTRAPHPDEHLSLLARSELLPVLAVAVHTARDALHGKLPGATPKPGGDPRGFTNLDLYISSFRKRFWANPNGPGLAELEQGLSGLAETARQHRLQIVVAIIPDGDQFHTDKPDLHGQEVVRSLCDRYGLPWLDLYDSFHASPDWPLFFNIMHPNGPGHEIIARELADYLLAHPPERTTAARGSDAPL